MPLRAGGQPAGFIGLQAGGEALRRQPFDLLLQNFIPKIRLFCADAKWWAGFIFNRPYSIVLDLSRKHVYYLFTNIFL
jgi:hypothetical protein